MKKIFIFTIILTQAFIYNSCNGNAEKKDKSADNSTLLINESDVDQDAANFIKHASLSSIIEIEYGKVAEQNAKSESVKSFAQAMIKDHTRIYNEMKKLATDKKILLPIKMEQGPTDSLAQLQTLSGEAFDQNYMQLMVSGHQKAIENFKLGAQNRDATINKFASEKIELLKEHLNSAISTYNSLNKSRS